MKPKPHLILTAVMLALPGAGLAQSPPTVVDYDYALYCASMYEIFSYDAEAQGQERVMKERLASSDKAYARAGFIGVQEGKSPEAIKADMEARVEKMMAKPPSVQLARVATQGCDGKLGLRTP